MKKRSIISLILVLVMTLSLLVGCGSTEPKETEAAPAATEAPAAEAPAAEAPAEKEPPVVYYVGPRAGGLAWNQSKEGFDAACADLGIEGYFIAPQTPFNNSEILELLNTAMTNQADIIMGNFSDPNVYGSICKEMSDRGIVSVALGNFANGVDVLVAPSYTVMGETFCAELESLAGDEPLNILALHTAAGVKVDDVNACINAFCEARGDGSKLVDTQFVNGDAILGADVTGSSLRAYPEINAIIVTDATGGLGCGTYIMENNLGESIHVIVEANSGDCINAVLKGGIDKLVNWEYYDMGYQALTNGVKFYYGEEVEAVSAPAPAIITPENGEAYAAEKGIQLG